MATVLIVDDHAINRELVATLVAHKGHKPLEAADGAEGLAIARDARPDLVISDILMPTMDGYEFVRRLRADPLIAGTEVVFYTAFYHDRQARALAAECGVRHVLTKPCEPGEILEVIENALRGRSAPAPHALSQAFDHEHLRLVTDKLAAKAAELEAGNQRLAALTELNLQLASERDPNVLLAKVCRGARELVGAAYAVLVVGPMDAGMTRYVATGGMSAEVASRLGLPAMREGVVGAVFDSRKPRRAANPDGDPVKVGLPSEHPPVRSLLVAPILSLAHAYGWICLANRIGVAEFSADDERLLAILAMQVGRIYENGSLYAALRESREGLQHAQELARLAHVITYADGGFESWSDTLPKLLGLPSSSMPKSTREWFELVPHEDRGPLMNAIRASAGTDRMDVEYRLRRSDGTLIDIRQVSELIPGSEANAQGARWFGTLQDISAQKRAEGRIRRLYRVYAVLSRINNLIVRVRNREELFSEACRIAVEEGNFKRAWVGTVDPVTRHVTLAASAGVDSGQFDLVVETLNRRIREGVGVVSETVLGKVPVISNDIANDPRVIDKAQALASGSRAIAGLPLIVGKDIAGLLVLHAGEVGFFDAEEMKLLVELAGDIAFALDHLEKVNRLDYLAYYDELTGLANRALFQQRLEEHLIEARASGSGVALLLMNIERFKLVNDALGRQAGDEILRQVAARTLAAAGDRGRLSRVGGDVFAIMSYDIRSAEDMARRTERRIEQIFGAPFEVGNTELRLNARFGIAMFPEDGADPEALFRNAEVALKKAKASSERYVFYTQEMNTQVSERLSLESKLRDAIIREEFVLHYQPKVDLVTRAIVGVEALIRWQSPDLGLVPPFRFIPLLEETGMILDVGTWALHKAVEDHKRWVGQGLRAPRIAVNVSQVQLRQRDFIQSLECAIAGAAVPHGLDLEITESLLMEDIEGSIGKLKAVRDLGIGVSIDDFGTGYSSLAYLGILPVQILKIDRSFINRMLKDPNATTLVSTMISLAHSLRMKVVAEGVEEEEQAKMLRLLRCEEMQGYLFSKPLPLVEITELLARPGAA